jgi:hypothetical protein
MIMEAAGTEKGMDGQPEGFRDRHNASDGLRERSSSLLVRTGAGVRMAGLVGEVVGV